MKTSQTCPFYSPFLSKFDFLRCTMNIRFISTESPMKESINYRRVLCMYAAPEKWSKYTQHSSRTVWLDSFSTGAIHKLRNTNWIQIYPPTPIRNAKIYIFCTLHITLYPLPSLFALLNLWTPPQDNRQPSTLRADFETG